MLVMKRITLSFVTLLIVFSFFVGPSFASSYVLPYPSTMPGGLAYKLHLAWERALRYWYSGSFGQFVYNLKKSDKYLVEAKTLFEYQQYLLGYTALEKSNEYFALTLPSLDKAKSEGKNIEAKRIVLHQASLKHIEVLQKMERETPAEFTWSPEKNPASLLHIQRAIQKAIQERETYL